MTYSMDRANRKFLITCDSCRSGLDYAYGWKGDGTIEQFKAWAEKDFQAVHKCRPGPVYLSKPDYKATAILWTIILIIVMLVAWW